PGGTVDRSTDGPVLPPRVPGSVAAVCLTEQPRPPSGRRNPMHRSLHSHTARVLTLTLALAALLGVGVGPQTAWGQEELFVANCGNSSITVYPRTASGNTAPLRTLTGVATGLSFPSFLAVPRPTLGLVPTKIAGTGMPVPGGSGLFTTFRQIPAMSAGMVAFLGVGSAGEQGVYSCDSATPVDLCKNIADLTTPIPEGT